MTTAIKALSASMAALLLGAGLAGCEREGPLERAGEEADETVEDVRQGLDDTAERLRDERER